MSLPLILTIVEGNGTVPISNMWRMRLKEVEQLAQGHLVGAEMAFWSLPGSVQISASLLDAPGVSSLSEPQFPHPRGNDDNTKLCRAVTKTK